MIYFWKLSPFVIILFLSLIAGCASSPPAGTVIRVRPSEPAVLEKEVVTVPPKQDNLPPSDYLVGPGDLLIVDTFGLPQISQQDKKSSQGGPEDAIAKFNTRVDGTGTIYLPWVGGIQVSGLTIAQVQEKIKNALTNFVKNPWVVAHIQEYKSQPLYLLGEFNNPGTYYLDRPLNLLEGLAQGHGFRDSADLRAARLIRNKKTYPVDIYRLLEQGDSKQNIWLKPGDFIFVPDNRNKNVFVFGAVKKPGLVPMPHGQLTLAQALAVASLQTTDGDMGQIRIIRSLSATQGELLVVDLANVMNGKALPYPLNEGDIVFVPRSRVGDWNQAINEILPSLQLLSGVLQPFVQLKFLQQ